MNPRQVKIRRAIMASLQAIEPYLLPDDILRAEAARLIVPRPLATELDQQLLEAERTRQITGASRRSASARDWRRRAATAETVCRWARVSSPCCIRGKPIIATRAVIATTARASMRVVPA